MFDLGLEATELPLFTPVVERRDEDDNEDGDQDGNTFDPLGLGFGLIMDFLCDNVQNMNCDRSTGSTLAIMSS